MFTLHDSRQVMTASADWKKLPKTVRWAFLGMWTLEDSSVLSEIRLTDKDAKPTPNFTRYNERAKKVSGEREAARRAKRAKRRAAKTEDEEGF